MLSIVVVIDNEANPEKKDLVPGWGLSLYVECERESILFDVGHDEYVLRGNARVLGLSLDTVRHVVISHEHGDHTGGIGAIVELGGNTTVYLPSPSILASRISGLVNVRVLEQPEKICDDIFVVPFHNGTIPEQAVVINKPYGLIVLVGCSHPGPFRIINTCTGLFKKKVRLLVGGLHLFGLSHKELMSVAERICNSKNIDLVCPLHCSGTEIKRILGRVCPEKLIYARVGDILEITPQGEVTVR